MLWTSNRRQNLQNEKTIHVGINNLILLPRPSVFPPILVLIPHKDSPNLSLFISTMAAANALTADGHKLCALGIVQNSCSPLSRRKSVNLALARRSIFLGEIPSSAYSHPPHLIAEITTILSPLSDISSLLSSIITMELRGFLSMKVFIT